MKRTPHRSTKTTPSTFGAGDEEKPKNQGGIIFGRTPSAPEVKKHGKSREVIPRKTPTFGAAGEDLLE